MRIRVIIVAFLACLALPGGAAAEDFAGEDSLMAHLPSRRLSEYLELKILMNPLQMRQYLLLATERERSRWVKRFWAELDPTPATEKNERRTEHERRVSLAREYFRAQEAPGWDDRGEALIRWGLPSYRMKIRGDVTLRGVAPPGETWYYHRLSMTVDFKDLTLTENYTFTTGAMKEPLTTLDEVRRVARVSDLARSTERRALEPVEFLDPQEFKNVLTNADPGEIDYWRDMYMLSDLLRYSAMRDLVDGFDYEEVKRRRAEGNFEQFLNELRIVHQCDIDQNTLPLHLDIARFRGKEASLRTEFSFEVPADELGFAAAGRERKADVEFIVLVRDYDFKNVARGEDRIRPSIAADAPAPSTLVPGQVVLFLEPGYYRVAVEAFDRNSKKRAAATRILNVEPCGGSPALSDIQFASGVGEAAENKKFVKSGLLVVPHPCGAYRRPFPVSFYFEIYGLDADAEGRVFYRVEYRIVPLEKKRWGPVLQEVPTTISSSFETSGFGAVLPERLTVATEELWEGQFRLEVKVTDRRTFRTAEISKDFSIVE